MPAPIISGLVNFLSDSLGVSIWEGELPRQDPSGVNVNPEAPVAEWPAIDVEMEESGLERNWTFEDGYGDEGPMVIVVYGTTRQQVEPILTKVEVLLADPASWEAIGDSLLAASIPTGPTGLTYFVYKLLLLSWTCVQEKEVRTQLSKLLYRGEMIYEVGIHGAVSTRD